MSLGAASFRKGSRARSGSDHFRFFDSSFPEPYGTNDEAIADEGLLARVTEAVEELMRDGSDKENAGDGNNALPTRFMSLVDVLRSSNVEQLVSDIPDIIDKMRLLRAAIKASSELDLLGSRVALRGTCGPEWQSPSLGATGEAFTEQFWTPWPATFGTSNIGMSPEEIHIQNAEQRKQRICHYIAMSLKEPVRPAVLKAMESDGSVPMEALLASSKHLDRICFGNPDSCYRAIRAARQHFFAVNDKAKTVRLLSATEQIRAAAEIYFLTSAETRRESVPLSELLYHPPIRQLVAGEMPMSSTEGISESLEWLKDALADSDLLELQEDSNGTEIAVMNVDQRLRDLVERSLGCDELSQERMRRDGEITLSYVLDLPAMRRAMANLEFHCDEAAMDAIRQAMKSSTKYYLDSQAVSLRLPSSPWPKSTSKDRYSRAFAKDAALAPTQSFGHISAVPTDRDTRFLRKLLVHYFDPFSLQYNRASLHLVQTQADKQRTWSRWKFDAATFAPTFSLEDIRIFPRIAQLFSRYTWEACASLLAAAVMRSYDDEQPKVRLQSDRAHGRPRGSWLLGNPKLELTYEPKLRFLEFGRRCPEVRSLLDDGMCPHEFDPHVFLVGSYSISSDISNSQSPKALELREDVANGSLDASVLDWEYRMQRMRRQLSMFQYDILCIQGIQSLGFKNRCSESDQEWFWKEDEPSINHLAHFYRDLSKENYSVAFSPTLRQPGSQEICFGNAIFWKRSRWSLDGVFGEQNQCAIYVVLNSQRECPPLLVCCSKSAASYARDWGDAPDSDVEAQSLQNVEAVLAKSAQGVNDGSLSRLRPRSTSWKNGKKAKMRVLWCGDFACELPPLLTSLQEVEIEADNEQSDGSAEDNLASPSFKQILDWRSACDSILGSAAKSPWTCARKDGRNRATDLILHDEGLEALTTLGGLPVEMSVSELMGAGNPSDHLLQLAMFTDGTRNHPQLDDATDFPTLARSERDVRARSTSRPRAPRPRTRAPKALLTRFQ
eukprot:TRINITY_DN63086_c0_g1_i1.p1 TRINITY_DN63086_c0_g1~~TRINITY_DN63086_c0_g1_i1.p1  ORF type:complete len:1035 (+),score=207.39 TRINITY_DN63086_c0_g1_i1:84-3107(+)